MKYAQDIGIDAFIIADIGVMALAKKYAPNVDIHMSTQVGIVNYQTANTLYEMGASRIVTAREQIPRFLNHLEFYHELF